jgi:quercetin dioxygenase-like cupin family protein
VKAPIEPFFINQAPEFMFRSKVPADLVIQRLVAPGGPPLAWHTHPGPAFALVEQGQVMLTRVTKDGCTTAVYGPGDTYYEVADQVHRVTYLGTENVEYKVRFNIPVGAALSTPADEPDC